MFSLLKLGISSDLQLVTGGEEQRIKVTELVVDDQLLMITIVILYNYIDIWWRAAPFEQQ